MPKENSEKRHEADPVQEPEEPYEGYELLLQLLINDPLYLAMKKEKSEKFQRNLKENPQFRAFMMTHYAAVLLEFRGDTVTATKLIDLAERTVEKHKLNEWLFGEAIRDLRKAVDEVSDINKRIVQRVSQMDPKLESEIDITTQVLPFL